MKSTASRSDARTRFAISLAAAHDLGLSLSALQALVELARHNGAAISPGYIGARLDLTAAAMTGIVDNLVARKLATRKPCTADRRRIAVSISARGSEAIENILFARPDR